MEKLPQSMAVMLKYSTSAACNLLHQQTPPLDYGCHISLNHDSMHGHQQSIVMAMTVAIQQ